MNALTRDEKLELLALVEERARRKRTNWLRDYVAYPKQAEFHRAGSTYRERLLMAGNQQGKTLCAGAEAGMHATGRYPDWWEGRRWDRPTIGWAASETMEVGRDAGQRILLGRDTDRGTGAIPLSDIIEMTPYPNVKGAVSKAKIRHVSGGISTIIFKSYDQGRKKFQGDSIDWGWPDEEPPEDIYSEMLTRTNATGGLIMMTFTPLLGMSKVVKRFQGSGSPDRIMVRMGIKDALHYTDEQRQRLIDSYPEHERQARIEGLPMLGEGAVFPIARDKVSWEATEIPGLWVRICGIDFGWDHPTAAAWLAWDRDADVIYVYDVYAKRKETPVIHSAAIRARGAWIPVAWPHDGLQHDKGSGVQLAQQYRDNAVNMLPEKATFEDGSNGVEAGVAEMLDRMKTGRLKFASHLELLWTEFNGYHRKDGQIVKEDDDILSAVRYALMMKRYAINGTPAVVDLEDYPVDY